MRARPRFGHLQTLLSAVCLLIALSCLVPMTALAQQEVTVELPASNPQNFNDAKRSDFWRQVREGMQGSVNIPSKEGGVLIQRRGADWGTSRSELVASFGIRALAISIGVMTVFILAQRRLNVFIIPFGRRLVRVATLDRLGHWLTGGSFVLLGTTGLNMLYGKTLIAPYLGHEFHAKMTLFGKYVHNNFSWLFMFGVVLMILAWLRDHVPAVRRLMTKASADDGFIRKFRLSEKTVFWLVILGGVIVSYSGQGLLFPSLFGEDISEMQFMQIVHSIASLSLTALISGHIWIVSTGLQESARKLAQDKEELEQRVAERTAELTEVNRKLHVEIAERRLVEDALKIAKSEAELANKSKDKFLAAASHDLLQPLNAARLMVSTLRHRALREENREMVNRIHIALNGAESLLTDLLDITRLDQQAVSVNPIDLSVADLLNGLETEFGPLAREAGLELRVIKSNYTVKADRRLLSRVLRNFISNAIRYTVEGRVLVGCRLRPDHVRFEIWDTGPGIPKDLFSKIFEEFHQLPHQTRTYDKGVGLGLAIVERITKILGYHVDVQSEVGKGSMFALEVPFGNPANASQNNSNLQMPPRTDLTGVRVLVLDNEESARLGMTSLLQEWKCEVIAVSSKDEAVAVCAALNKPIDIILADYQLDHGVLGTEVISALRGQAGKMIPAVVISANRDPDLQEVLAKSGLSLLPKPVRAGKLRALVTHLLALNEQVAAQ